MLRRLWLVVGLVIWLGSTPAKAASAAEVLPACKLYLSVLDRQGVVKDTELAHLMDAGECLGAIYTLLNVSQILTNNFQFCPPVDADVEHGVRAVVTYIETNPDRASADFTAVALEALQAMWPCR
jgi:hypothetical protein